MSWMRLSDDGDNGIEVGAAIDVEFVVGPVFIDESESVPLEHAVMASAEPIDTKIHFTSGPPVRRHLIPISLDEAGAPNASLLSQCLGRRQPIATKIAGPIVILFSSVDR